MLPWPALAPSVPPQRPTQDRENVPVDAQPLAFSFDLQIMMQSAVDPADCQLFHGTVSITTKCMHHQQERSLGNVYQARLSPSLSDDFDGKTRSALEAAFREGSPGQGFTFLPLDAAEPHRDGRWLGYKEAETLSRTRPDVSRLLLVELIEMHFYPRNMAVRDTESVEAKYRIHVDFFDLHPAKPGTNFWYEHSVTRPLRDWLAGGEPLIAGDLAEALGVVAEKTRSLLAVSPAG